MTLYQAESKFVNIPDNLILPLISASAVLQKQRILRKLIIWGTEKKIRRKKIYEALLQTYLFAGYPSALISLNLLNEVLPLKDKGAATTNWNDLNKTGMIVSRKIYGNKLDKLLSNISLFSPELSEWLVTEGYGKVLSRRGLSLKERELSIVAVLTVFKFEIQLYSHLNGAYRLGVSYSTIEELMKSLDLLDRHKYSSFGLYVFEKFKTKKYNDGNNYSS